MSSAVGPRPPTVKASAGRAAQHAAHLGGDGIEVVAHQHGARHRAAEGRHEAAEQVGVGVEHVAQQDLVAGRHDLDRAA